MNEVIVNKNNFEKEILNSEVPVLVDFFATWCGPCSMLSPIIEEIANENVGKLKVCKIDIDQNEELAMKYRVSSIPTVMFFKNGKNVDSFVGYRAKTDIDKIINNLFK